MMGMNRQKSITPYHLPSPVESLNSELFMLSRSLQTLIQKMNESQRLNRAATSTHISVSINCCVRITLLLWQCLCNCFRINWYLLKLYRFEVVLSQRTEIHRMFVWVCLCDVHIIEKRRQKLFWIEHKYRIIRTIDVRRSHTVSYIWFESILIRRVIISVRIANALQIYSVHWNEQLLAYTDVRATCRQHRRIRFEATVRSAYEPFAQTRISYR